ncbi:MAG: nucleotide exchange factor GrpE [Prosthecobacter sp.]|uniref:nucleotide exchange factor GrpE n=1 Tax=Prosthecobacter sp. TaxID=1965333 RepID=UPI00390168EA
MPDESDSDQDELDREIRDASPDTAEVETIDEVEDEEQLYEDDITLTELRDEISAGTAENRRTARRTFDVLKQFGTVLDAMSATVNDLHRSTRTASQAAVSEKDSGLPRGHLIGLIELADRLKRLSSAFDRRPAAATSWLPSAKTALSAWDAAWSTQSQAFSILSIHVEGLLKNTGLERMSVTGQPFDPACMTAVETTQDSTPPDHTVLAELLPGWLCPSTAEIIRPAQVRVSRR